METKLMNAYKMYDYPLNLIFRVTEDEEAVENAKHIPDLNSSVEYVLNLLTKREQDVIRSRYCEKMTLEYICEKYNLSRERIHQIEIHALHKLKRSGNIRYLKYGVLGVINKIDKLNNGYYENIREDLTKISELDESLIDRIINIIEDVKFNKLIIKNYEKEGLTDSIENAGFSVRTYNCCKRAGYTTISKLAKASYEDLYNIRNLGKKSIQEIVDKLAVYGYQPVAMSGEIDKLNSLK